MNLRKFSQVLIVALPIAATSFLGAGYVKTAPASGFRHSDGALQNHRLECEGGSVKAWLVVRFDPPLPHAPTATLSGSKPLQTWLTTKDGMQWTNIAEVAPLAQQPVLFFWPSGVEMHLDLPVQSQVADWKLHRETEKPDSASAVIRRRVLAGATFVVFLLSVIAAIVAPKIFDATERLTTVKCVEMLIDACSVDDEKETRDIRRLLRSVVLDGETLETAMSSMSGDPFRKKVLAILAVGRLKRKLRTFQEELAIFMNRLERTR